MCIYIYLYILISSPRFNFNGVYDVTLVEMCAIIHVTKITRRRVFILDLFRAVCLLTRVNGEEDAKLGAEGATSACTAVLHECACVNGLRANFSFVECMKLVVTY